MEKPTVDQLLNVITAAHRELSAAIDTLRDKDATMAERESAMVMLDRTSEMLFQYR